MCLAGVAHLESHHIIPREYGGQSLETVDICSTCHHGLHHQANAIWSAGDKTPRMYFTEVVFERASPFVAAIIQARRDFEELGRPAVRPRRVIVHVDSELHAGLHRLKKYHGYTSLERFIRDHLKQLVSASL